MSWVNNMASISVRAEKSYVGEENMLVSEILSGLSVHRELRVFSTPSAQLTISRRARHQCSLPSTQLCSCSGKRLFIPPLPTTQVSAQGNLPQSPCSS